VRARTRERGATGARDEGDRGRQDTNPTSPTTIRDTHTLDFHPTFLHTNVSFPTWAGKTQKEGNKEEKADKRAMMRRKSRRRTAVTANE